MNRIYQGKVTKGQRWNEQRRDWDDLPDWSQALWHHHQLFQDAVNYYIVCLLALATDPTSETARLRERITKEGNEDWVWGRFRRRGVWRRGLRDSIAPYITPGIQEPTFEQAAAAVLSGNSLTSTDEGRAILQAGLQQLLSKCTGSSGCRNAAPEFLPRLCKPDFGGNFAADTAAVARQSDKLRFPFVLHDPNTGPDSVALAEFGIHSIALPNPKKAEFSPNEARDRLRTMLTAWRDRQPQSEADWKRLENKIEGLPEGLSLPGYATGSAKGEVKFRLFAMFLFRYLEQSDFTLGLLRDTTPAPKPGTQPPPVRNASIESPGDPIRLSRGARGYAFPSFTSLPCWGGNGSGASKWIEFDIAAFEEALKALHQVDDKGKERKKELDRKQVQHEYQRGKTKKWKGGGSDEEEQRPPVLAGDPRIQRLEVLLHTDLADEYEMSEGQSVQYGLQARTIRGFRDLRKKWTAILPSDTPYSDAVRARLLAILQEYQKDNAETVGSVRVFTELLNESNWLIWREATGEQQSAWRQAASLPDDAEFAKDPLQALSDERELLDEIDRLKQPIRLTPADPEHSRRQFYFSDVAKFTDRGEYRHEPNQRTVIVPMAVRQDGCWRHIRTRLHYSAPRLLREGLRADQGENLSAMPWLQPMMAALGLPEPLSQDFRVCPVALMPDVTASGERRILLNFPLTLDEQPLLWQFGKAARWDTPQFGGADGESYWLRWPTTWLKEKPDRKKPLPKPWWEDGGSFRCLSVDLGQRDAGAFALLEVATGSPLKPQSRKVGEIGDKKWWATVRATGLLRLPGEDAMVLRDGKWQEELSGERGRLATRAEWDEAREICTTLGLEPSQLLGDVAKRYSFPELNDQLLYALRRAQSRLA